MIIRQPLAYRLFFAKNDGKKRFSYLVKAPKQNRQFEHSIYHYLLTGADFYGIRKICRPYAYYENSNP